MTNQIYDTHKAAGIIIQDRKVLTTRTKGKTIFVQPGGKLEPGETEIEAVIRELKEELGITVAQDNLAKIGDYYADAAGQEHVRLKLAAYMVGDYRGTIQPMSEIEEIRWFNSKLPEGVELGSIMEHELIPLLKAQDLID